MCICIWVIWGSGGMSMISWASHRMTFYNGELWFEDQEINSCKRLSLGIVSVGWHPDKISCHVCKLEWKHLVVSATEWSMQMIPSCTTCIELCNRIQKSFWEWNHTFITLKLVNLDCKTVQFSFIYHSLFLFITSLLKHDILIHNSFFGDQCLFGAGPMSSKKCNSVIQ